MIKIPQRFFIVSANVGVFFLQVLVLCLCSLCFQNVGCHEPVIASLSSIPDLFSARVPYAAPKTNTGAIIYSYE